MKCIVDLSPVEKLIRNHKKLPNEIVDVLQGWVEQVQLYGIEQVQKVSRYKDHSLRGDRRGQRAISLSYKWRAIYTENLSGVHKIIRVEEVTPHDYRKK